MAALRVSPPRTRAADPQVAKRHLVMERIIGSQPGQGVRDLLGGGQARALPIGQPNVAADPLDVRVERNHELRRIKDAGPKPIPGPEINRALSHHPAQIEEQTLRGARRPICPGHQEEETTRRRRAGGRAQREHESVERPRVVRIGLGEPGRESGGETPMAVANFSDGGKKARQIIATLKAIHEPAEPFAGRRILDRRARCGAEQGQHPLGGDLDGRHASVGQRSDQQARDLLVRIGRIPPHQLYGIPLDELLRAQGLQEGVQNPPEDRIRARPPQLGANLEATGAHRYAHCMPIRVFVVEDQAKILKAQIKVLETFPDIEIVGSALSGETALEEIEKIQPEVILCDLGLPQMSGIEVTRAVKQKWPSIEILIFTIFDEEEKVIEAIGAGAAGYLLKGAEAEKIVEAIKDVKGGGAVIQPNLAKALLRLVNKAGENAAPGPMSYGSRIPGETPHVLTERELEILQIIAKGLSNNEAAKVLGLSKATIRTHLEHIYEKLDVTNRVEAVTEGIRQGIINI